MPALRALAVGVAAALAVTWTHPGGVHLDRSRFGACSIPVCHPSALTSPSGSQVVDQARHYRGVPYRWGGSTRAGMDCSGLVVRVYSDLGAGMLPHRAADLARRGAVVHGGLHLARPGDLLFWGRPAYHVAIYTGSGRLIEAPKPGRPVSERPVYGHLSAIRRIPVRR